jgi:thymidylate synthase (FAD)
MTHQLVRHTWLNFSQRSHRYTKVDSVVIPPSVKQKNKGKLNITLMLYEEFVTHFLHCYKSLIEVSGVPREDARFISPAGASTTIMASGPLFVWQDFASKRNHPKAQWEIRKCASIVEKIIEYVSKSQQGGASC